MNYEWINDRTFSHPSQIALQKAKNWISQSKPDNTSQKCSCCYRAEARLKVLDYFILPLSSFWEVHPCIHFQDGNYSEESI